MFDSLTVTRSRRNPEARGSSRVLMKGTGPCGRGQQAVPGAHGQPAEAVHGTALRLHYSARAADKLPGDQERDQDAGQPAELAAPGDQVILLAAVRTAWRVGAGLEHRDLASVAFFAQPLASVREQPFQDPLARLVMHDQFRRTAALRRRVLGAAGRLQVQPAAVPEQHADGLAPGRDRAEQAAPCLLGEQLPLPASGEDNAVGVPEPENARVHKAKTKRAASQRLPVEAWRKRVKHGMGVPSHLMWYIAAS
jgi:hypothetical protein